LKDLHKLLKGNDRKLRKLGQRMSEAATEGSMDIWGEDAMNMNYERRQGAEAVIEEEINMIEEKRESKAEEGAERERETETETE
jgi:hypothetical protein